MIPTNKTFWCFALFACLILMLLVIRPKKIPPILLFAVAWSLIVVAIDCFFGLRLLEQYASKTFLNTTGQITHSEVTQHYASSGRVAQHYNKHIVYDVNIRYHYEVNGQSFEGTRFRYIRATSLAWAQNVVATHPIGSTTQVFYNPKDPQDSLLSPGIEQSDLYPVLILTPFNLIMLFLLYRSGRQVASRQIQATISQSQSDIGN
jgi:hypothetical protein